MESRSRTTPPRRIPRARWTAATRTGVLAVLSGVLVGATDDAGPARPAAPLVHPPPEEPLSPVS